MTSKIVREETGHHKTLRKALREVVGLFVTSFHVEGAAKNDAFLPFDPYPSSFRRRFSKHSN